MLGCGFGVLGCGFGVWRLAWIAAVADASHFGRRGAARIALGVAIHNRLDAVRSDAPTARSPGVQPLDFATVRESKRRSNLVHGVQLAAVIRGPLHASRRLTDQGVEPGQRCGPQSDTSD